MESRKKFQAFKVDMYKNGEPTAAQEKDAKGNVVEGAYRGTDAQAADILSKMRDTQRELGGNVGITYSANHNQTLALSKYYQLCDDPKADPQAKSNAWNTVITEFTNQGAQGRVMGKFLAQLTEAERSQFRILPVTTMARNGSATQSEWLQNDMQNINDFLQNNGNVLAWQNEDATDDHKFAIGGNIAGGAYTKEDDAYVQKHLKALENAVQENDPIPAVTPHNKAVSSEASADLSTLTPQQKAEQERRNNEQQHYKNLWLALQENRNAKWTDLGKVQNLERDKTMVLKAGPGEGQGFVEPGFYRREGDEYRKLRTIHFQKIDDKRTGEQYNQVEFASRGWSVARSQDIMNGRDFLQSQGCRTIEFDYGMASVAPCLQVDTIKFLLDSVFNKGWEKKFDSQGNLKPGASIGEADYKQPPVGIKLGENLKQFIANNIDQKNILGKPTRAAKRAQKMLYFSELSQARLAAIPAAPKNDVLETPKVTERFPEKRPEEVEMRPFNQGNSNQANIVNPPQQPSLGAPDRLAALTNSAHKFGEAVSNMVDVIDVPGKDGVFTQNDEKKLVQLGNLINIGLESREGTDKNEMNELKELLSSYIKISKEEGKPDSSSYNLMLGKLEEMRNLAHEAATQSNGIDKAAEAKAHRFDLLLNKFKELNRPEMPHTIGLNK